jgi:osmoprotectant transport system ATP-binding protein
LWLVESRIGNREVANRNSVTITRAAEVDHNIAMPDPSDGRAVVVFDDVTSGYGGRAILTHVSLSIDRGESLALVGRSGAGKSTLLKLVNGIIEPQAGSVRVEGRDTREWDPIALRRRTGYVLQDIGLFPHLTVEENITLVPRLERWDEPRRHQRANELLELVGLPPADYASRRPAELSGGQRQRVGVARALAINPPVVLMDEPFGALDPITRAELRREFQRIRRALDQTVLLVTHDMAEAFALGDRVGVIDNGTLVACDAPDRVARSDDPRVRALLDAVTSIDGPRLSATTR